MWSQANQRPNMAFTKFYSYVVEIPPRKSGTKHGVHEMWKGFRVQGILCEVKQVRQTQHTIHKIYPHVIKTPPSKLETQHEVHGT